MYVFMYSYKVLSYIVDYDIRLVVHIHTCTYINPSSIEILDGLETNG